MPQSLAILTLASYLGATIAYLAHILFRPRRLASRAYWLAIFGLVVHGAGLLIRLPSNGYPFIVSYSDAYAVSSWAVAALFVIMSRMYRFQGVGAFLLPAALSLLILSLFGGRHDTFVLSSGVSPWLLIHLLLAFLAFAVFVVSFVIGIAYILLESRLKAKTVDSLVRRLPPLEVLDGIHYKALGIGLLLLTASIIAGTILNKVAQGVFFTWDAKQLWVLFTWFLYAVFLELRIRVGWRGRRGILLSVLGFIMVFLAFFGLQHGPL